MENRCFYKPDSTWNGKCRLSCGEAAVGYRVATRYGSGTQSESHPFASRCFASVWRCFAFTSLSPASFCFVLSFRVARFCLAFASCFAVMGSLLGLLRLCCNFLSVASLSLCLRALCLALLGTFWDRFGSVWVLLCYRFGVLGFA